MRSHDRIKWCHWLDRFEAVFGKAATPDRAETAAGVDDVKPVAERQTWSLLALVRGTIPLRSP